MAKNLDAMKDFLLILSKTNFYCNFEDFEKSSYIWYHTFQKTQSSERLCSL